jgi:hypothetical protein
MIAIFQYLPKNNCHFGYKKRNTLVVGEASRSHALFLGSLFSYSPKREFLIFNFENQLILEGFQLPEVRKKYLKNRQTPIPIWF